ncbi:MAG: holin family protein [Magnetococcus sp. WYHC-3]
MGFWDDLAEGGITGLFKGVGTFAKDIRTAITGKEPLSSEQQAALLAQVNAIEGAVQALESKSADGQIELNKIDAQSDSFFKSGWRPSIGWVCSLGLGYSFLLKPLLPWSVSVYCLYVGKTVQVPAMPTLDTGELISLTFCLLGFGGYRMYERIKGKV